jgi:SAM-dependent methyltransferase
MNQPHDNWAKYYDFVYQNALGDFYDNVTNKTLNVINELLPEGKVIDYGAGTGRIAIPLKKQGYEVIAVERSSGMASEIKEKCKDYCVNIPVHNCSISEFDNEEVDLALALYAVLNYSISEGELKRNIVAIYNQLKPNGYFFFDLLGLWFFKKEEIINVSLDEFYLREWLTQYEGNIYTYHQEGRGVLFGNKFHFNDEAPIRYWDLKTVNDIFVEIGFEDVQSTFPQLSSESSTYKLYKKL